jgi:putative transcription factor
LHGALVEACSKCQDNFGITRDAETAMQNVQRAAEVARKRTSGGWGGLGTAGKDIMFRGEDELVTDFANRIKRAREDRGWDQRTLALRMKEKVNVIQRAESGHAPLDKVVKKFERTLNLELKGSDSPPPTDTSIGSRDARGLSLGDLLEMAKKEED